MEGREITEVIQGALNRADLTNLTVDFIGLVSSQKRRYEIQITKVH